MVHNVFQTIPKTLNIVAHNLGRDYILIQGLNHFPVTLKDRRTSCHWEFCDLSCTFLVASHQVERTRKVQISLELL